jgi:uncharacterized damage-inducible protein DinB
MNALNPLQTLARYKAWADDRLYRKLGELPDTELTAPRAIVFGSILRTLHHVHAMDLVWKAHLEGVPHFFTTRDPEACPAFAALLEMQRRVDAWYIGYAGSLSQSACEESVEFTFIGGGAGTMTRAEILHHVVNHTTYHRGHIATMIYQIPSEPPTTDLPVFLGEQTGTR